MTYSRLSAIVFLIIGFPLMAMPMELTKPGMWSSTAIVVRPLEPGQDKGEVPSPDKKYLLSVESAGLKIVKAGGHQRQEMGRTLYLDGLAEVGWSKDSKAFFITRSAGGWVGEWYTRVIFPKKGETEIDITKEALADYQKRVTQCPNEMANAVAVGWVEKTDTLLLVIETPDHSSCPDMGNIEGYLLEVPSGRIVERYNKESVRKRYQYLLGTRLRGKH